MTDKKTHLDRFENSQEYKVSTGADLLDSPITLTDLQNFISTAQQALTAVGAVNWQEAEARVTHTIAEGERIADLLRYVWHIKQEQVDSRRQLLTEFDVNELANNMLIAQTNIYTTITKKNNVLVEYRATQAELEAAKNDILLGGSIDGKNAEVRSAQLAAALAGNPATQHVEAIRANLDALDAELELWRMRYTTAKARLGAATAALNLLAS